MAQYLLGQLTEQQEAELETRYLADDTCFDELLAAEQELRDAYERGELSPRERDAFHRRLLSSPQQQDRQAFARALRESLSGSQPRPHSRRKIFQFLTTWPRMILIPAASAAMAVLVLVAWWAHRTPAPLQGRNAPPTVAPGAPPKGAQGPVPSTSSEPTLAIVLTGDLVRGVGHAKLVTIPPEVTRIRLEARFHGDYPRYQATLETAEGKTLWHQDGLQAAAVDGAQHVLLNLSRSLLPDGDYILILRGESGTSRRAETVAEYAFTVAGK